MLRFVRFGLMGTALCGLFLCAATRASRQVGATIGTGTFTSSVENMDRSLAFYHDVFDMEVPPLPESGERPYNRANPQLFAMFDIPGARGRRQSARMAGTRLSIEMMEIQQVDHCTTPLRVQDAGAATVVFVVRDIDAALARIEAA
jgi:glyoxalase/bleomycin resistance protein/dioxygenase superfamily protein